MTPGKYIVIEGHDGTGKSTQVGIIRQKLSDLGIESIEFHEPAGSPIADSIRTILKNGTLERDALTELLLFSAARHDIWTTQALPALKNGKWVIAARNYYSTLAYQGYGQDLNLNLIESITLESTDGRYMQPDMAFILDLDDEKTRLTRIKSRGELINPDTFESKDQAFQDKVKNSYIEIAKTKNIPIISAGNTPQIVFDNIWNNIPNILAPNDMFRK
jgi:dTMP kinase